MESTNERCSRFPRFYGLSVSERLARLKSFVRLNAEERYILRKEPLSLEHADAMIENVVGVFGMPLGLAVNFRINDKDYILPMAVEESSVVAGLSHLAKLVREPCFSPSMFLLLLAPRFFRLLPAGFRHPIPLRAGGRRCREPFRGRSVACV